MHLSYHGQHCIWEIRDLTDQLFHAQHEFLTVPARRQGAEPNRALVPTDGPEAARSGFRARFDRIEDGDEALRVHPQLLAVKTIHRVEFMIGVPLGDDFAFASGTSSGSQCRLLRLSP